MIASLRSAGLCLLLASCGRETSSAPNPLPAYGSGRRCDGTEFHLITGRVETAPSPYQDSGGRGQQFDVIVAQVMPASRLAMNVAPVPTVGERIRIRRRLYTSDGQDLSTLIPNYPQFPALVVGMTTVFTLGGLSATDPQFRPGGPLPMDPSTNTLTVPWMQFPPGTAASQILNPVEWNDPMRGCAPVCQTNCGAPIYSDAAVSDVPTNG